MAEAAPRHSREDILRELSADRRLAHETLFRHRRPNATPEFHGEIIDLFHSTESRRVLVMAFRGGAKSTLAEEWITLAAGFREFRNGLILGSNAKRAAERLYSVSHELGTNEYLASVFGDLRGPRWTETKIELPTGAVIQSLGRGQDLRGLKHLDQRPDLVLLDDIEGEDDVANEEARNKMHRWVMAEVIPACIPDPLIRVIATPLDPDSLPMRLIAESKLAESPWVTRTYPVEYADEKGHRRSAWPSRYPLEKIDKIKNDLTRQGLIREYRREYLCQAEAPEEKAFKREMIRIQPQPRTWQAVYAMIDPARTANRETSATTGCAIWSWIGARLVVWDAWAKFLLPDEILEVLFAIDEEYSPVMIGVEEDGLNEFLMQPIRREQMKRGISLPVRPIRAPKGKLDFIRGLQPYFNAREVIFAQDLPELTRQLVGFPTGRIDAPNALAYALRLRPGAPVYDNFTMANVAEDLSPLHGRDIYLATGATGGMVCAALVQVIDGAVRVYRDWVREGEPAESLAGIVKEASVAVGRKLKLVCAPEHFDKYNNCGLVQAANRIPMEVQSGVQPETGRPSVRKLLETLSRGFPALLIASEARWTLNGFSGGYARALGKQGLLASHAEEGQYRVLLEALESFVGLMDVGMVDRDDNPVVYATARNGRRYVSALAKRR